MQLTFHGVRGSTPCHGHEIAGYGGNTSCVSVAIDGAPPIMFDIGTGARYFGLTCPTDVPFDGVCLLTHMHWDHIQGLPFFTPLLRPGGRMQIHAPAQDDGTTLEEIFDRMLRPPLFPVTLDDLPGEVELVAHSDETFDIGPATVTSRMIPHVGETLGYRLELDGASVAYLSDHQQPGIGVFDATDNAKELCRDVDVLIHDAQFTPEEFALKSTWGHCTVDYAVWLAQECDVRTLVLYHHDPTHDDAQLDRLVDEARVRADGVRVIGAREKLTLDVGR